MSARRRSPARRVLPWLGLVLLVVSGALGAWSAFRLSRGTGSCALDGVNCSGDFVLAIFGALAAVLLVTPVGVVLGSARVPRAGAAGSALLVGGAAAGVWAARFAADPVTEATTGTWIATAVLGVLALVALRNALGPPPAGPDREAISRAVGSSSTSARVRTPQERAALRSGGITRAGTVAQRSGTATSLGATRRAATPAPVTGMPALHALLVHGVASGRLGHDAGGAGPAGREQVAHLVDLHRRGAIGDADLVAGLRALSDD